MTTASDRPAFLVGLAGEEEDPGTAPALVIGATNLTTETQLAPLLSCDPEPLSSYPRLPRDFLEIVRRSRQLRLRHPGPIDLPRNRNRPDQTPDRL
jgi:hypothetical protein